MSFLVAIAVLLVLPHPWNFFAFAACLVLGIGEVSYWNRTVKHRRVAAGAETLIGATGKVLSRLAPSGQLMPAPPETRDRWGEDSPTRHAFALLVERCRAINARLVAFGVAYPVGGVEARENHARAERPSTIHE